MSSHKKKQKQQSQRIPSYFDGFVSDEVHRRLEHVVAPHVESFNYFLEVGMDDAINAIDPMEMEIPDENLNIRMQYSSIEVGYPTRKDITTDNNTLTPREARESGITYAAKLVCNVEVKLNQWEESESTTINLGELPIMVMSDHCHLRGKSSQELVTLKEEANEVGGYFIMNGIERVIRLLQVPRRNYATAIERSSYKNRGLSYSDKGIAMRCVRPDQSSVTITLHYLNNGGATLKFVLRKQEFLLPVVMIAKALVNMSDKELFDRIVQGDINNTFLTTRLEVLLRDFKNYDLYTKTQCLSYLGSLFRGYLPITDAMSDEDAGLMLIKKYIFIHTENFADKLECLLHMIRKLFAFAEGKCVADNADALMNHELLLPGHLLTMYLKEKLEELLLSIKQNVLRDYRMNKAKCLSEIQNIKYFTKNFDRFGSSMGGKIGTFLSTGNIISSTGLDLMQVSGYTIVAERLNIFRYMSHFQSIHRGQFFTTMKTTAVRKLLPESWGYLCPVHTPDGSPCGLLNHIAKDVVVVSYPTHVRLPPTCDADKTITVPPQWNLALINSKSHMVRLLSALGALPSGIGSGDGQLVLSESYMPILFNGILVGGIKHCDAFELVTKLRYLKARSSDASDEKTRVDPTIEIAYFPHNEMHKLAYPGIYLFTQPGRMIRPVQQRLSKRIEWIGPLEQVFMDIACLEGDIREETTHLELNPTTMLSHIASLTPYSDYNQSPRNMYQCQMGKQTMGTPAHALKHRADNKLYRIQNPQSPIVQNDAHREYAMDEYPQGTNAVVAVISFTGYDMEDAMIINKAAFQRGFGHGSVYKTFFVDLEDEERMGVRDGKKPVYHFSNIKANVGSDEAKGDPAAAADRFYSHLDDDGLPSEGTKINYGDAVVCLVDVVTGQHRAIPHKDNEEAFVDTVRIIGMNPTKGKGSLKGPLRRVSITMRYRRNPIIGDKFSSRHGQKGTLSVLWPQENMPFTESGITPDVLINPHAFPSRMTIGMLIESMAGKSGAMHGIFQNSTPFQFHEEQRAIDYMGEQLKACGYQYFGSEPLYNGLTGNLMHADIFIGVVFYQRLRHMVSDKSQVRSTGPVMAITRQPVKGRKKHGGIRLGEMERDALLSHGVAFCLHDRLMGCSDTHLAYVCGKCGNLLTVYAQPVIASESKRGTSHKASAGYYQSQYQQTCSGCKTADFVQAVYLPYVYRYLTNELAGMGIKVSLTLSN